MRNGQCRYCVWYVNNISQIIIRNNDQISDETADTHAGLIDGVTNMHDYYFDEYTGYRKYISTL